MDINFMYKKPYHIHFIGIGGIGMSGIAYLLLCEGYTVSGCDAHVDQKSCLKLVHNDAHIYQGNNTHGCIGCTDSSINCVVYSTAIPANHPELIRARKLNIPTMHRAAMLATLMRKKSGIAISGAHGKTTTTGLIAHLLLKADLDPSVIIGGFLRTLDNNAHAGIGPFFVAEADESDRSFLQLPKDIALVTNIDKEHLETYVDVNDIQNSFLQFIEDTPPYGIAILCIDNEYIRSMIPSITKHTTTYGFSEDADIQGRDITLTTSQSSCSIFRGILELGSITIPTSGKHILQNALGAVALGLEIGIPFNVIKNALATFPGVERRFAYHGTFKGAAVYDDYGHHPNEIIPTVQMAQRHTHGKLIVVFQPHRYSRMKGLWQEFVDTLGTLPVDHLIITDIYSAGESEIPGIETIHLLDAIKKKYPYAPVSYTPYITDHTQLSTKLASKIDQNDLILLMGAGSIYSVAQSLCNENSV
jgi:UDP-N-acetylmuramate--alanine ligase